MPETIRSQQSGIEKRRHNAELNLEVVRAEELLSSRLEAAFSGNLEDQRVFPTSSDEGTSRIRAYILDDDAGMGYIENTHWFGIAQVSETRFAVESHYPYSRGKLTVFTTFNTETGVVEQYKENDETRGEKPLAGTLEITGDYKRRVLTGLYHEMNDACLYEFAAYEHRLQGSDKRYKFELEQLQ